MYYPYPDGLKPGDFIQTLSHFADIFFEVKSCLALEGGYWMVTYYTYDKYGSLPRTQWVNRVEGLRAVLPAEMAIPVMLHKRLRFKASFGQYDPLFGFAPAGKPLRTR